MKKSAKPTAREASLAVEASRGRFDPDDLSQSSITPPATLLADHARRSEGGAICVHQAWPVSTIRPTPVAFGAGLVSMVDALRLSRAARRELGHFHRHALTVHVEQLVVDQGTYSRVRHPLYTATAMASVGIGLTLGSWGSLALSSAPIAALVHRIKVEEQMLVDHLGDDYRRYQQATSRLVPGVW